MKMTGSSRNPRNRVFYSISISVKEIIERKCIFTTLKMENIFFVTNQPK
jgi:hypothetical protein